MAISPWTKPLDMKIAPLPFEALAYGYEKQAKRQEEADKGLQDLNDSLLKIGAIPVDAARRDEIVGSVQSQVKNIVDKYGVNNLQAALPEIKNLNRQIQYETTYGELGGIKSRYDGYLNSQKQKQEYVKKYIETGGKEGMNPEDAEQQLGYELNRLNANPIGKTKFGTWDGYQTMAALPSIDYNKEAFNIAKEIKPTTIEQRTGLKIGPHGYLVDESGTVKALLADEIEKIVLETMSSDPRVMQYTDYKHTISGNKDTWKSTLEQSPYGVLSTDGQSMENPETWLNNRYYKDIRSAARNAGNVYRQYERTSDIDYKENWQARDAAKEARERELLDFPLPAQTTNAPLENIPAAVTVNPDGSIQGGEAKADDNFIKQWGILLAPVRDMVRYSVMGMFDPGMRMGFEPTTKSGKAAKEGLNTSMQDLSSLVRGDFKTEQQLVEEQATKLRQDFPEVAAMFPKATGSKQGKEGTITYDKNAGNVINFVNGAVQNSSAVIGNMLVPESPQLAERIQKTYFNSNVFNKVTYRLQDGETGTKKEADEVLGFEGNAPQEALDKAIFNGYGGFLNPGSILAQIPDEDDVPRNIIIEPDNTTKSIYKHSRIASKVFSDHKAEKQIMKIRAENGDETPYYFEYVPYISQNGTYGVKINQYNVTPTGDKSTFVGQADAFEVYKAEHTKWLEYNNFKNK